MEEEGGSGERCGCSSNWDSTGQNRNGRKGASPRGNFRGNDYVSSHFGSARLGACCCHLTSQMRSSPRG